MMDWSWTEVQALGVKAAGGAGVPPAQALAFGAMLARHLADGGAQGAILRALDAPDIIVDLAHRVDAVIEAASVAGPRVRVDIADADARALMVSWLSGLPCQVDIALSGTRLTADLALAAPSSRARPDRVQISAELAGRLRALADLTLVPDSDASRAGGAGAALMELD